MPVYISLRASSRMLIVCFLFIQSLRVSAVSAHNFNLIIAPGTITDKSATLLWDKQAEPKDAVYEILLNGKLQGATVKTNYTLTNLSPGV